MSASRGPTVRQRRLGIELRRLRELKSMTGDEVASRLSWSTAKVSRLENARTGARVGDVAALLELYGVTGTQLSELMTLAQDAAERGWWEDYPSIGPDYAQLIALEADAGRARCWENLVVPGLLQTEAYARAVIRGWEVVATVPPTELERLTKVRMLRQQVLRGPHPLALDVVLDESVLWRRISDPATMADQLTALRGAAREPCVSVRILPLRHDHPILGSSFTLLEFADQHLVPFPDVVHTESLTFSYLTSEAETHRYRLAHERMKADSLDHHASLELLAEMAARWRAKA
ncbi:helix-turn-helix domain-containing protein [Actinomadura atramentaria]|uniref:helix-turn-helix domain-containing protein n=1 Tax=Actinomadura atramentaria TaxID=1990 RepID=UPI00036D1AB1|nr:helix-turn-helix transcriptional regulator [Actinomadura atramentaria]